jgi:hypothetical protein
MKTGRDLFLHLGLLALGTAAAVGVWTRDKEAKALVQAEVTVWPGRPDEVDRILYEGKKKKVTLDAKKDGAGRYFVGVSEKDSALPEGDAGPAVPPKHTSTTFVSVGPMENLTKALAPLKAIRDLGRVGDDRASEFGLADPEATLTVKIGGVEHKLLLGAATPGGSDRYARDPASNEVYVVGGAQLRNLESPDASLLERDLHEWKDPDPEVARAKVTAEGKVRELVRGAEGGKKFWADAASPATNDETVGNWMSKLDRMRPTEYVETLPEGKQTLLRVEYAGSGKALGFVELVKAPSSAPPPAGAAESAAPKPDYFLVTERTRLYAKVTALQAEQVEQDVGGLFK